MPSTCLPRHKGLQTSSQLLLFGGRSLLFGSTAWLSLSNPFSALAGGSNACLFPRSTSKSAGEGCVIGCLGSVATAGSISLTLSLICSATGPSCQSPSCHIYRLAPESVCASSLRNIMSGCSYLPGRAGLVTRDQVTPKRSSAPVLKFTTRADIRYSYKGLDYCRRVSSSLRNREPGGRNMVNRCFWSDAMGRSSKSNSLMDPLNKDYHLSCTAPYSAAGAADVSFDGTPSDEHLENSAISSEQKLLGERTLKLVSGSCYLPHPDKEDTGGEDAHFICVQEQAIGVADGVGGWADLGVDAGQYARELMSNSVSAIQDEPKGSIDPARVLETAYSNTKAKGSSTACIIALTDQGIHAVNLGDSGFIVVRDGCTLFRSPVQQHDFNFTYQLESGNGSDLPSAAQVFNFPVACGDVIITGTDGLFDNLYNNEVTAVIVHAMRAGLGPQVTAQKIAALARQRAQDRNRQTPFSTAAQDAGYRYYGGKLDDITVVVSFITAFSG